MSSSPPEDYYALLGVDAGADSAQLRRAWRRLALEWHPDRAGPAATGMFQRLSAAYEVLSDPLLRAAYDRRRRTTAGATARAERATRTPDAPPSPPPPRAPRVSLHRQSGPLRALLACGVARYAEGDVIELELNAQEAAQGGMVTISMPVAVRCRACGGETTATPCARCRGAGVTQELFSAWLAVPPGIAHGTMLAPTVLLRGMVRPIEFRVCVRAV